MIGDRSYKLLVLLITFFLFVTLLRIVLSFRDRAAILDSYLPGATISGYGVVVADPVKRTGGFRLLVRLQRHNGLLVSVTFPFAMDTPLRFGDRVWMRARILPVNPCSSHPGWRDLLGLTVLRAWGQRLRFAGLGDTNRLMVKLHLLRTSVHARLMDVYGHDAGLMLSALVLGMREQLPYSMKFSFRASGLAHLLAVSGFHVGIVALVVFFIFRFIFRVVVCIRPGLSVSPALLPTNLASIITVPLIFLYVILTGGRASAVRAALMLSLYLVARVMGRERPLVTAVVASFLLILMYNPMFLMDPGFQLTYLAMAGIVAILALYRGVEERVSPPRFLHGYHLRRWLRGFSIWLFISVLLPLFLWPWIGFMFHRVSLVAPVSNLLLTPLASLIIAGGFLWSLISSITFLPCRILSLPVLFLSKIFLKGVYLFGTMKLFPWVPFSLSLFLLVMVVSLFLLFSKYRKAALVPVLFFLLFFAVKGSVANSNGVTALTRGGTPVLFCRHGDISCLLMPSVSPYLVDRCVLPGLMRMDMVNIDVAVVTASSARAKKEILKLRGIMPGEIIVPMDLYLALKGSLPGLNIRPLLKEERVGCFRVRPGGSGKIFASVIGGGGG